MNEEEQASTEIYLPPDYNTIEYAPIELLERGDTDIWLRRRGDILKTQSKETALECEASKIVTLGAFAGAAIMSANPLAWIGLLIAGSGYVYTLFQERQDLGVVHPVPLYRGKLGNILAFMEGEEPEKQPSFMDEIAYLSSAQKAEAVLIWGRLSELSLLLKIAPPKARFDLYRYTCEQFYLRQDLITGEEVGQYLTTAVSSARQSAQLSMPAQIQHSKLSEPSQPAIQPQATDKTQKDSLSQENRPALTPINLQEKLALPLKERAIAILERLSAEGFDLSRCIAEQITCICGNQRGGKGTLMAILAILSSAIDPATKIHYFTAGDDLYPFKCDRLVCRLSYPGLDGDKADLMVAQELYRYLKEMDNTTQGACKDIILVIDEAVALSDYLDPEQKQWMIRFLLTRANKKGAQIFIVLHGINLTSWVGTGNAGGFSQTFKTGATFLGCEATSQKINPLRSISVATGRYFLANPDDFSKPLEGGNLGLVPEWLKTEINPATGQPDPARTLLEFFPELKSDALVVKPPIDQPKSASEQETPTDKKTWDRLIWESTDEQINSLIEQRRSKPEKKDSFSSESESLLTVDSQIDYAVQLVAEYLQEKNLDSDTARNIFNFKSKLKKVAKTLKDFNDLLEVAAEMKKICYFADGKSNRVGLIE